MNELIHCFRWHAADTSARYYYGRGGYLVMDGSGAGGAGACCSRYLQEPITDSAGALEVRLRVVLGHRYALHLYDSAGGLAAKCHITPAGWITFSGPAGELDSGLFLTWFRGRPCVDPQFVPGTADPRQKKAIESDEHCFRFTNWDFDAHSLSLDLDGEQPRAVPGGLASTARDIVRFEVIAEPSEGPGNCVRVRAYRLWRGAQLVEEETYPIFWEPAAAVARGYASDNTREAVTRLKDYRWLECVGEYCWVKARLPFKAAAGELEYSFSTPDVSLESCLELHEQNGTLTEDMWPIKVGIIEGKFFAGFAVELVSKVTGRTCWQSQQAWYPEVMPEPERIYRVKIAWEPTGRYRWWLDGQPMTFRGVAKTGKSFEFAGFEIPGHEIPFTNAAAHPPYTGIDTIALHYGLVSDPVPHRVCYGDFKIRSVPW